MRTKTKLLAALVALFVLATTLRSDGDGSPSGDDETTADSAQT
ncbi:MULTISPECIES: hypothetical protein [Haloferax]|nr:MULTISPECIES: hypothetical protein [Haloferax]